MCIITQSVNPATNNFANSTYEEYMDTAKQVLAYLDEQGLSAGVFMPDIAEINEFKGEVYREAANGLAWLVYENEDSTTAELETALAWAEKAEKNIRDEADYYILDTRVRILLRLGRPEDAYRIVYRVLQEDPEFTDFQDFIESTEDGDNSLHREYVKWLKSRDKKITRRGK